jgi:hypothetical protein
MLPTNAGAGSDHGERVDALVKILDGEGPVEVVLLDKATDLDQALDQRAAGVRRRRRRRTLHGPVRPSCGLATVHSLRSIPVSVLH